MHSLSLAREGPPLSAESDATLVRAARRDAAAFARLYRRYVTPIYRYVYNRVGHAAEAEDLTSQVFAEALEGLPGYREQGHFSAWLFGIARRRIADHHRHGRSTLPLDDVMEPVAGQADLLTQVVRDEALGRLGALIGELGEAEQELLRLRFAGELTYAEIGAVVGRSEAAVKMAVHRLLRRLAAEWEVSDA